MSTDSVRFKCKDSDTCTLYTPSGACNGGWRSYLCYVPREDPGENTTGGRVHDFSGRYSPLQKVLLDAYDQASSGKGSERHSDGQDFEGQPIMWIEENFKSFQLGQAVKKIHESQRMEPDRAEKELLGAINYLAARILFLKKQKGGDADGK